MPFANESGPLGREDGAEHGKGHHARKDAQGGAAPEQGGGAGRTGDRRFGRRRGCAIGRRLAAQIRWICPGNTPARGEDTTLTGGSDMIPPEEAR